MRYHRCTDDTQLYFTLTVKPSEFVEVLNRCEEKAIGWRRTNKLKLNPDKTEVQLVNDRATQELRSPPILDGIAFFLKE